MLIAVARAALHEDGVAVLDLLLLPPLARHIPPQHKHIASAGAEDGKSFRTLQVRSRFDLALISFCCRCCCFCQL